MTYSSISVHAFTIFHYTISFLLLFVLLPSWVFTSQYEDRLERWFSGYVKMVLLIIICGYILVITKLYEFLSLFVVFLALYGYQYKKHHEGKEATKVMSYHLKKMFDLLDGLVKYNRSVFITFLNRKYEEYRFKMIESFSWLGLLEGIALAIIICVSSYLRFYDTFVHAALPMSDSYVTLAWMKYIDARSLFHDGIYPQGFHIYLATLFKFAAVDPLFILRYTGPLNSIFTMIGFYFVVRKLTKNGIGAVVAAWLYGILYIVFPFLEIQRQAATNSQEFAFVFIFPAIYFSLKYLLNKGKEDLFVGLACLAILGLVHSLAFALAGMLLVIMIVCTPVILKNRWKEVFHICLGAVITVVLSLLPLGAGFLLGKDFNSSSAEYLVSKQVFSYPKLNDLDFISLGLLAVLLIILVRKGTSREDRFIGLFTIVAGGSVFFLYYAGGVLTQSTLIASRSADLWGLTIPFCAGIAISYLLKSNHVIWNVSLSILSIGSILVMLFLYKPEPIIPYKLEYDENIEQYLHIRNTFGPKTWMMVSQEEGYSVALGAGYHMHLGDFLKNYSPNGEALTKTSDGSIDKNLAPNIFIFQEKKLFEVSKTNSVYSILEPQYKRRMAEYEQLTKWINIHKDAGFKVDTFFEDQNIIVYYLRAKVEN